MNTLYPGIAYLVSLTEEHTFVFPQPESTPDRIVRMPKHEFSNPTKSWNDPLNTGVAHIFSIYREALDEFSNGDVIGAFDADGRCVGMTQIKSTEDNLPLIIYGDDPTTPETDGMEEGGLIRFRLMKTGSSAAHDVIAGFDTDLPHHNGRYSTNGLTGIISFKEGSAGLAVNEMPGLDIYPNPASNKVSIVLPGSIEATAKILNAQGQLIMTELLPSGLSTLDISTLKPGIYLIEISGNDKLIIRKFVKR